MKTNIPILYYHFIKNPEKEDRIKGLNTTKKQFEWQIKKLIKYNFNFITFEDIIMKRYDASKRNIIITFDDGCVSLYKNAFPVMQKYKIRGVIYIVVESIGQQSIVWEQNENKTPINILSIEQIKEMAEFGIEFGSHSNKHVHLELLNEYETLSELTTSKKILEGILNKEVYSVAYPFGTYNETTMKMAKKAGYKFATTTKSGDNKITNDFEICRLGVKGYAFRHYWYFKKLLNQIIIEQYKASIETKK